DESTWVGTLPSDTEFGKAALTPGSKFSFNIELQDADEPPVLEFDIEAELDTGRERGLSEFGVGVKGTDPRSLVDFELGKLATDRVGEFVSALEAQRAGAEQRNTPPAVDVFPVLGADPHAAFPPHAGRTRLASLDPAATEA
uniref:hypothetical protein n=1 Tax=Halorubrum lacusprofundi TaxID=2247 RepID=UPI0015526B78